MGADLILAAAEMPGGPDWKPEEWRATYHKIVNELDFDIIDGLYEELRGDKWDYNDGDLRDYYHNIVDEYIGNDFRDCNWFKVHGGWVLLTGGMSWGDDPSDSWDSVNTLSSLYYCYFEKEKDDAEV